MLRFSENACRVVAADAQAAFSEVDTALGASLRMTATIIEAFKGSSLPAGQSQKIYELMGEGMGLLVQGRRNIVTATGRLQALQAQSNVAEVSFGCPWIETGEPTEQAALKQPGVAA